MNVPDQSEFKRERRIGISTIALSLPVALILWWLLAYMIPPLKGMDTLDARMLFTLKCFCVAVLFCLVTGVESVAHERLFSPAFDPLLGFETRRLRINKQYLQNTLEQIVVFGAALFGLAAYSSDGYMMRIILATTVLWVLARFAFWLGYHHSAAFRGFGAAGMALSMLVLLYVVARIGYEAGGVVGAVIPIVAFLGIEAILFTAARSKAA
jgi:hypothetical protein